MKQLHPFVYVSCAISGTAAIAMLIVSDAENLHDLGKWGLFTALVSSVLAGIIICDRFACRICKATHREAEVLAGELEEMLQQHTGEVVGAYGEKVEDIAEAVCSAVARVVTPIRR